MAAVAITGPGGIVDIWSSLIGYLKTSERGANRFRAANFTN